MYRIGDFSTLSKTSIKALRYYEKVDLLKPSFIDKNTGYRYYETNDLLKLSKIISLRQIGLSIKNIKEIFKKNNVEEILNERKKEVNESIIRDKEQLLRINHLLEEKNMKYEIVLKELPEYDVYYKEGVIKAFDELPNFIVSSGAECMKLNPDIKCIEPDYCYVSYMDREYRPKDIKIRYSQAVTFLGKESDSIKFEHIKPVTAACTYHKGSYTTIREAYSSLLKWVEDNGYVITEPIRERYIDGMWNKQNEEDWLTEIEIPVKKAI